MIDRMKFYSNWTQEQLMTFEVRPEAYTGISKIDERFAFPAGFYVIAGSPGSGKGWLATWLSKQFLIHNSLTSVYFSLEMGESLVRTRILQQWSMVNKKQFEEGGVSKWALDQVSNDQILIDSFYSEDLNKQTPKNFIELFEEYYSLGYRVFHFDHMHELSGANDNNRNQQTMELWSKAFQGITKKYKDTWLFVYVQPNGKAYDKNFLTRADISGSKVVIQKCDYFLSLNRERPDVLEEESRDVYLYIDKNRYSDINHKAFKLEFSETGNFQSGGM